MVRSGPLLSVAMTNSWCGLAVGVLLLLGCSAQMAQDNNDLDSQGQQRSDEEFLLKQVVWKRCHRRLTPGCLKLNLVRTVELMSKDSSLPIIPGVYFTSNTTESPSIPPEVSRSLTSEQAPLDDLVAFALGKYLRSLTLNVHLVDFVSGGNKTLQNSVIDVFSGRGTKNSFGGYGAIAAMMGGMMASMMMAALAALAGKALMTSMLALMMAAFSAMKGGGDSGHESKTYEVITKPVVSHINTHSSEVQHHDHGHYHRRSLNLEATQGGQEQESVGPYYKPSQVHSGTLAEKHGSEKQESHGIKKRSLTPREMENANLGDEENRDENNNSGDNLKYLRSLNPFNLRKMRDYGRNDHKEKPVVYQFVNKKEVDTEDAKAEITNEDLSHHSQDLRSSKIVNSVANIPETKSHHLQKRSSDPLSPISSGNHQFHQDITKFQHPRQNHKEFKRHIEDDLIMALGLFR